VVARWVPRGLPDGNRRYQRRPADRGDERRRQRRDVATAGDRHSSQPAWSPDGRRIAFERGPAGDSPGNDVWSMAADGTDRRRLTATAGLDGGPAWSPSGSRIAFTSARSGSSDIWTTAADGADQRPLTPCPGPRSPGTGSRCPARRRRVAPSRCRRLSRRRRAPPGGAHAGSRSRSGQRRTCGRCAARASSSASGARRHAGSMPGCCAAGPRSGGRGAASRAAGTKTLTIRLTARARTRLAGVRRATLTLRVAAVGDGQRRIVAA
jgi:WD40-like Beta Propeller Repeat